MDRSINILTTDVVTEGEKPNGGNIPNDMAITLLANRITALETMISDYIKRDETHEKPHEEIETETEKTEEKEITENAED